MQLATHSELRELGTRKARGCPYAPGMKKGVTILGEKLVILRDIRDLSFSHMIICVKNVQFRISKMGPLPSYGLCKQTMSLPFGAHLMPSPRCRHQTRPGQGD